MSTHVFRFAFIMLLLTVPDLGQSGDVDSVSSF